MQIGARLAVVLIENALVPRVLIGIEVERELVPHLLFGVLCVASKGQERAEAHIEGQNIRRKAFFVFADVHLFAEHVQPPPFGEVHRLFLRLHDGGAAQPARRLSARLEVIHAHGMHLSAAHGAQREGHRRVDGVVRKHALAVHIHRCAVIAGQEDRGVLRKAHLRFKARRIFIHGQPLHGRLVVQPQIERLILRACERRPFALPTVEVDRRHGRAVILRVQGMGREPRHGRNKDIFAEQVLVAAGERAGVIGIFPAEAAEQGRPRQIIFIGGGIEHGQQTVAHSDVLARDGDRLLVVAPRLAEALHRVGAVRTEDGRERAELDPPQIELLVGIAEVSAEVGIHIGDGALRGAQQRLHLRRKGDVVARDVPRPLDAEAVGRAVLDAHITAVGDFVDVRHEDGAARVGAARLFFIEVPRDLLEDVHSERLGAHIRRGTFELGAPIPVVPPGIQPEAQKPLQFLLAEGDLFGREQIFRALDGLGMVVEHDLHAVLVREGEEAPHVGEERGVDVVADAPIGRGAPVGIQHHVVERDAVFFIVEDDFFGALLVVSEIFGVPRAERRKARDGCSAREGDVQPAQRLKIAIAQKEIDVLHALLYGKLPSALRGIAAFGRGDARRVRHRPYGGRLMQGRKFARVFFVAEGVEHLFAPPQQHAFQPLLGGGKDELAAVERDRRSVFLSADGVPVPARERLARGDEQRIGVIERAVRRILDAHDLTGEKLYAHIVYENILNHIFPHCGAFRRRFFSAAFSAAFFCDVSRRRFFPRRFPPPVFSATFPAAGFYFLNASGAFLSPALASCREVERRPYPCPPCDCPTKTFHVFAGALCKGG